MSRYLIKDARARRELQRRLLAVKGVDPSKIDELTAYIEVSAGMLLNKPKPADDEPALENNRVAELETKVDDLTDMVARLALDIKQLMRKL